MPGKTLARILGEIFAEVDHLLDILLGGFGHGATEAARGVQAGKVRLIQPDDITTPALVLLVKVVVVLIIILVLAIVLLFDAWVHRSVARDGVLEAERFDKSTAVSLLMVSDRTLLLITIDLDAEKLLGIVADSSGKAVGIELLFEESQHGIVIAE